MNEFGKGVIEGFVAAFWRVVYLYLFGFIIVYILLALFGINIWTFVLAHVAIVVLWVLIRRNTRKVMR